MCVDGRVTSSSGLILVLPVRDVEMHLGVAILFGKTEIDDDDLISTFADTHQEVVRLDIVMNEVSGVDVFDSRDLEEISGE